MTMENSRTYPRRNWTMAQPVSLVKCVQICRLVCGDERNRERRLREATSEGVFHFGTLGYPRRSRASHNDGAMGGGA